MTLLKRLHIGPNILNLCMFIWQVPMGFGDCFESAQIFNVPNSFDDFSFFLLLEMGY